MGVILQETPPPVYVEHEGWLCVMFWMQDVPDVHDAARRLIDIYRDSGVTVPQVVVVDHSRAMIVMFDRARCLPSTDGAS